MNLPASILPSAENSLDPRGVAPRRIQKEKNNVVTFHCVVEPVRVAAQKNSAELLVDISVKQWLSSGQSDCSEEGAHQRLPNALGAFFVPGKGLRPNRRAARGGAAGETPSQPLSQLALKFLQR